MPVPTKITYFPAPADFRKWLQKHHATRDELWVGYHKKGSGTPSLTWPESVDEALCFGWIDGIRKRVDEDRYTIRFTPRRRGSIWSAVNIKRAGELKAQGLMQAAGLEAFQDRREFKSAIYSYEQRSATLPEPYLSQMKKKKRAWAFFSTQPPGYQKMMSWWVVSAKKEETRLQRLEKLIAHSLEGKRV
ncbi:MAG: hypothetical protein QOD75_1262 [Blastocatellia bacterium]|jgi:uncharacterized protein YdeI (YjbR/CyaY-like superfamily)|nr:hypothetical protein [Blastocatellia bacterium]